jgi:hypothetical protein
MIPDAEELRQLSRAVRRLRPDHRDPERWHVEKDAIAARLADLSARLEHHKPVVPDLLAQTIQRKVTP